MTKFPPPPIPILLNTDRRAQDCYGFVTSILMADL